MVVVVKTDGEGNKMPKRKLLGYGGGRRDDGGAAGRSKDRW